MHVPVDQLIQRLGKVRPGPRGKYLRFNCPFCTDATIAVNLRPRPDTSQCLFISLQDRGGFGCIRCGAHGARPRLLAMLGLAEGLPPLTSDTDYDALRARVWAAGRAEAQPVSDIAYKLPPCAPVPHGSEAMEYLVARGVRPQWIADYNLRLGTGAYVDPTQLGPDGQPKQINVRGRIVIPDDPVDVKFWVARLYQPDAKGPKYKNPPGEKGSTIFFLRRTPAHRVILVEGSFDAIIGGPDCAALLGKEASWAQIGALLLKAPDEVLVSLDGEARAEQDKLARELATWGLHVRTVQLPYGADAAAIGRREFRRYVAEAVPWVANPEVTA